MNQDDPVPELVLHWETDRTGAMDRRQADTFKTKLYKENSSFCIDSLLSSKPPVDKKEQTAIVSPSRSSPPSSPSNSFPPTSLTSLTSTSFPLLTPSSGFPASSHPLLPGAPHPIEHLLKQELFPAQSLPLEFLARSGLLYQNYPHFAGQSEWCQSQWSDVINVQDILILFSARRGDQELHSHPSSFWSWRNSSKRVNISLDQRDMKLPPVYVYQKLR